jgi:hypothetical protein
VKKVQKLAQKNVNDVITCLGRTSMIVPLFSFLSLPPDEIPSDSHANFSLLLFNILKLLLVNSTTNQTDFLKNGFSVLGYTLAHVPPESLSVPLLDSISEVIANTKGVLPGLILTILQHILFDFELWIFADFEVQLHLFAVVLPDVIKRYPKVVRNYFVGVQGFLDIIRCYYWEVFARGVSRAPMAPINRIIKRNREGLTAKGEIRCEIFKIIRSLLGNDPSRTEFRAMIDFILCLASSDPKPCEGN